MSTDILEASGKAYLRAISNAIAHDVAAEAERVLEHEAKKTPPRRGDLFCGLSGGPR